MAGTAEAKKYGIFRSVKELSQYSKEIHKIFQNDLDEGAEEGGPWDNKFPKKPCDEVSPRSWAVHVLNHACLEHC